MFEAFKGLNIADPKFYIPVIAGVIILFIILKLAKKLIKFALFIAVIALVVLVYFNLPIPKVNGSVATLKISGHEYTVDARHIKIEKSDVDGKSRVYLVSGETRIELPFSADFAERFIKEKIQKAVDKELGGQTGQSSQN